MKKAKFIIFGGGCYGTFYTRQLLRAADKTEISEPEIIVVDHNANPKANEHASDPRVEIRRADWDDFMDEYMRSVDVACNDQFVPPPFTPHLALAWLLRRLNETSSWRIQPFNELPVLPYVNHTAEGTLTTSHADWMCPTHCIEPETCPHTKGPRSWDMAEDARSLGKRLKVDQIHLFQCLHLTHGVGTFPVSKVKQAYEKLAPPPDRLTAKPPKSALVATLSRCHGAMHLLKSSAGTDTVSPQRAGVENADRSPDNPN